MDSVWHLNAPQWTDFASSPQPLGEDYFEREHKELEPQPSGLRTPFKVPANPVCETNHSKPKVESLEVTTAQQNDDNPSINEIEMDKMTPIKVISPKTRSKKNILVKETTYDSVLSEAMASLQLSVNKKSRRSRSIRHVPSNPTLTPTTANTSKASKSLNLGQVNRSTPSNPIPLWIRKQRASENLNNLEKNEEEETNEQVQGPIIQDNSVPEDDRNKEDVKIDDAEVVTLESTEPVCSDVEPNMEGQVIEEKPKDDEESNDDNEAVGGPAINDLLPETALPPPAVSKRSNFLQRSSCSNKAQQARFSTCQIRRRSLIQYRRRSNKYVSLAEAISKFQNSTPKRFRSASSKTSKPGPLQKVQQSSVAVTVPISPALRCKLRKRATSVLSQEEREKRELKEIRKHSVRENMARTNSMKSLASNPAASKTTGKKPASLPDSANSTETKTTSTTSEKITNRETSMKITVPAVVSTIEGLAVQNTEITNFGVPNLSLAKPTTTKMMPFSFELRNKELQTRKEKKIKELMTEEENKSKSTFHARPVPTFKKPMHTVPKETNAVKPKTKPCPFSFEERDKKLIKKKENYIKTVLEEDKKARTFQAKPIPEFKPVLVRGISRENLNSGNKTANHPPPQKTRISMLPVTKTGSRNSLLAKGNCANQENRNPSLNSHLPTSQQPKYHQPDENQDEKQPKPTKVLIDREFHLNTDKRAKERKDFDERIKQKEQEIELLKKEAEAEKLKRDEHERAEIRRMAETKARPMPAYKPPAVIRSNKPLTEPQSPGWAGKPKC